MNFKQNDLWTMIHAERAALAKDLSGLTNAQWSQPSLCDAWTIRQTLAHLTAAASLGPLKWISSAVSARFDFDLHNERRLNEHLGGSPADTLAKFNAIANSTISPWGPVEAWLGEVVVHGQDIRQPLGLETEPSFSAVTAVAEFYARKNFAVPSKKMASGLELVASDGPFSMGEGLPVHGPTLALVMAMAGRKSACDQLTGAGVEILVERCAEQHHS